MYVTKLITYEVALTDETVASTGHVDTDVFTTEDGEYFTVKVKVEGTNPSIRMIEYTTDSEEDLDTDIPESSWSYTDSYGNEIDIGNPTITTKDKWLKTNYNPYLDGRTKIRVQGNAGNGDDTVVNLRVIKQRREY